MEIPRKTKTSSPALKNCGDVIRDVKGFDRLHDLKAQAAD